MTRRVQPQGDRSANGAASPSSARYFPSFYLVGRGLVAVSKWSWLRRRTFAQAMFVLAFTCICLYGWWEHSVGTQRDAARAIDRAGGTVYYDWQWQNGRPLPSGAKPRAPEWLVGVLGRDFFGSIVAVDARQLYPSDDDALIAHIGALRRLEFLSFGDASAVTSQRLKQMQGLTRLKTLCLFDAQLSGSDLASLARMVDLEYLAVREIRCSDADLAHLSGLTKLKSLNLSGKRITNSGLGHLAAMTDMEALTLLNTSVTSLEPIRAMTRLKHLNLVGSPIDDDGLKAAAAFQRLEVLWLGQTSITDHGLSSIAGLPVLKVLDLTQTRIGDAGLALLCDNPRLTYLSLPATDVTDAGLAGVVDKLNAGGCQNLEISGTKLTRAGLKSSAAKLTHTQIRGGGVFYPIARSTSAKRAPTVVDEELPQ